MSGTGVGRRKMCPKSTPSQGKHACDVNAASESPHRSSLPVTRLMYPIVGMMLSSCCIILSEKRMTVRRPDLEDGCGGHAVDDGVPLPLCLVRVFGQRHFFIGLPRGVA